MIFSSQIRNRDNEEDFTMGNVFLQKRFKKIAIGKLNLSSTFLDQ
jgi:hypothetical protein